MTPFPQKPGDGSPRPCGPAPPPLTTKNALLDQMNAVDGDWDEHKNVVKTPPQSDALWRNPRGASGGGERRSPPAAPPWGTIHGLRGVRDKQRGGPSTRGLVPGGLFPDGLLPEPYFEGKGFWGWIKGGSGSTSLGLPTFSRGGGRGLGGSPHLRHYSSGGMSKPSGGLYI